MKGQSLNRLLFLDYARTIALFLVVFAHLYSVDSNVKLYIYAFHMPFFFMASGMVHRDSDYIPLLKKMTRRLLIPFCFFLFIGYVYYAISTQSLAMGIAYGSILGIIQGKSIRANDILWFLIALFWVRIFGLFFIRSARFSSPLLALIAVIMFALGFNFLYIGTALMAVPFYIIGYYAKEVIQKTSEGRWHYLVMLLCLILTVLISNYNGKVSMMGCSFGRISFIPLRVLLFYLNGIIGSLMIMCLVGGVEKKVLWLIAPAKCAISIVGLQVIPIMIWYKTIGFNQDYLLSIAYSLLIILVCIVFHTTVERKAKWLVGSK